MKRKAGETDGNANPDHGRDHLRRHVEEPHGTKRPAEQSDPNDNMTEHLEELLRISTDGEEEVLIFEPDWSDFKDDLAEIYSPPRVVTIARRQGLNATWSFDRLVEAEPGVAWDLRKRSHQQKVHAIIEESKPGLVIGSPPCSWFSRIMQLNWGKISRNRRRSMMAEARKHLEFACAIYRQQHRAGKASLHDLVVDRLHTQIPSVSGLRSS